MTLDPTPAPALAPLLAVATLLVAACGPSTPAAEAAPSPAPARADAPAPVVSSAARAAPVPSASTAAPARPPFALGCGALPHGPWVPRLDITRDDAEKWRWACRAQAMLGAPKLRSSGYPDFEVADAESGVCVTLSLEDVGVFVYHAPPGRAEALRDALAAAEPVPDCTFEVGLDGSSWQPIRVGVRHGKPFQEPIYAVTTMEGARAFFEEHPSERSAAMLIDVYVALPAKARPRDLGDALGRAATIEIAALGRVGPSMLSDIGRTGYCQRARTLAKLPIAAPIQSEARATAAKYCR